MKQYEKDLLHASITYFIECLSDDCGITASEAAGSINYPGSDEEVARKIGNSIVEILATER